MKPTDIDHLRPEYTESFRAAAREDNFRQMRGEAEARHVDDESDDAPLDPNAGRYSTCDSCAESGVLGVNLTENQPGSAHPMGGSACTDAAACNARYDAAMATA